MDSAATLVNDGYVEVATGAEVDVEVGLNGSGIGVELCDIFF